MSTDDRLAVTVASYDDGVGAYLAADGPEPSAAARLLADALPAGSRVLEIGSGSGRDAEWLLARGLDVTVTDASAGFREHLRGRGLAPLAYDVVADDPPQGEWDALLANAVLLHVPRAGIAGVLARLRGAVRSGCRFVLSLKTGREDGWSTAKLDRPRWFTYWSEENIRAVLVATGWRVVSVEASTGRTDEWLLVDAVADRA